MSIDDPKSPTYLDNPFVFDCLDLSYRLEGILDLAHGPKVLDSPYALTT